MISRLDIPIISWSLRRADWGSNARHFTVILCSAWRECWLIRCFNVNSNTIELTVQHTSCYCVCVCVNLITWLFCLFSSGHSQHDTFFLHLVTGIVKVNFWCWVLKSPLYLLSRHEFYFVNFLGILFNFFQGCLKNDRWTNTKNIGKSYYSIAFSSRKFLLKGPSMTVKTNLKIAIKMEVAIST